MYAIRSYYGGPEISRPSRHILEEIRELAGRGVKEVVLLGQNVNAYGKKDGEIPFPGLLRRISRIGGIRRIRFITAHPRDLDGETIDLFTRIETLCPHVHLPIQAGSDRVLASMGRGYTREEYLGKVRAVITSYSIHYTKLYDSGHCGLTLAGSQEWGCGAG